MGTSFSPAIVITVMVLAIGLVLFLSMFGSKLPEKVRRMVELVVSVGYPAAVGIMFVVMAVGHYQADDTYKATGFGAGAAIMVLLAARAMKRWRLRA